MSCKILYTYFSIINNDQLRFSSTSIIAIKVYLSMKHSLGEALLNYYTEDFCRITGLRIAAESPPQPKQPPPPPPPQLKTSRGQSEEGEEDDDEEEEEHEDEEIRGYRPLSYNNQKHVSQNTTRSNVSRHSTGEYLESPLNGRSANGGAVGGCSEVSPSNSANNRGDSLRGFSGIMGKLKYQFHSTFQL